METIYIVWDAAQHEGYATKDKGVAYEARKGADSNCWTAEGKHAPLAVTFCEQTAFEECTTVEVVSLDQLATLLPGPYYMDQPDGGSVTVIEQFRRMAEDAKRWREIPHQSEPVCTECRGKCGFTESGCGEGCCAVGVMCEACCGTGLHRVQEALEAARTPPLHQATLLEFNAIIFDQTLALGDRLQRIASRIAMEGTEQQREMRRQESAEAASLQTLLMSRFGQYRQPYPLGLFAWAQKALEAK